MTDEELQNRIEQGILTDEPDHGTYRRVFDALKKEPPFQLPSDFASRVVSKIQARTQPSAVREFFWLGIGLISFVIAAGISIYLTGFKINLGVLRFLSSYPGLIIFGVLFILGLHWIDKQFVRKTIIN